jgi:hypothetical protein
MLETALASNNDPFTCLVADPGFYEGDRYWMECADIASATTLSNAIVNIAVDTGTGQGYTSTLAATTTLNYSATNAWGGVDQCEPAFSETGDVATVGDGIVDAFDISALLWRAAAPARLGPPWARPGPARPGAHCGDALCSQVPLPGARGLRPNATRPSAAHPTLTASLCAHRRRRTTGSRSSRSRSSPRSGAPTRDCAVATA